MGRQNLNRRDAERRFSIAPGRRSAEWALALTVVGSALALGGAHIWVVLVSTATVAVAGTLALTQGLLRRVPPPALGLGALGCYSLLQSIPLPVPLVARLSPAAAEVWSRSLQPFGAHVHFASLSLDPGASTVEAAKWLSYAVAFAVAAAVGRRHGAGPGLAVVFGSAFLVALATLAHGLMDATRVFGIYEPQLGTASNHVGPLLNSNCLAGYLILGVLTGLGFALSSKTVAGRWVFASGTAVIMGVAVLSGSRGGVGALALGLTTFAIVVLKFRRHAQQTGTVRARAWLGVITAIAVAATFSVLGVQDGWFELTHGDLTKLRLGSWVLPLVRDFPIFGVGRGAFESSFPAYKLTADDLVYANPESIVAQWISEWGIPFGGLGFAFLSWRLRPVRLGVGPRPLTTAAVVGVGALVLQNFVDFSLELFAPMLAATVILGSCWGQTPSNFGGVMRTPWLGRYAAVGLVAMASSCVGLAFARGRWPVSLERQRIQAEYQRLNTKDGAATSALWAALRADMERHPAEPYFPRLGALLALRVGDVEPLPWIGRSLDRGPVDSRTHWILACVLNTHALLQQALLEARLAVEYDPSLATRVGTAVAQWSQDVGDIERAAPRGPSGSVLLIAAASTLDPSGYRAQRERLLRTAMQQAPALSEAHRAMARELLSGVGHERCTANAEAGCWAEILEQANTLDRLAPLSAEGSEVRAQLYAMTHQVRVAERELSARCPELEQLERIKCWRALFVATMAERNYYQPAERAAARLVATACTLELDCEGALLEAASAMSQLGNWPESLDFYQRAVRLDPKVPSLLGLADAAIALGRLTIADRALQDALGHARSNPPLARQIEARRQSLQSLPR